MLVTYLHKWWNKVPLDESYTKAEKDSALDAFSMSLLLSRDEKLKTQSFRGNNSIIALIAEELGEHTFLSTESHKGRQSGMLNMSTHSLDGSPAGRILAKIGALGGLGFGHSHATKNTIVVPVTTLEMMKIHTELEAGPPINPRNSEAKSGARDEEMSLREYIIAKKRGSLGDNGEGLSFAIRNKSFGGERSYNRSHNPTSPKGPHNPMSPKGMHHVTSPKHHSRQESSNFDAALGRVMQLEANFGKGPASFGVEEL
jgi:hypothetical protein